MGVIQGMRFSTYDVENDALTLNCALKQGGSGAWWFNMYPPVCLTSKNVKPGKYEFRNELYWSSLIRNEESLEMMEIKLYEN